MTIVEVNAFSENSNIGERVWVIDPLGQPRGDAQMLVEHDEVVVHQIVKFL